MPETPDFPSPAAEKAYAAAERKIAQAKKSREDTFLILDAEHYHALERLPPQIATLTALEILRLRDTHVSDLRPLTSLTSLKFLDLDNTPVTDLRPLQDLPNLGKATLTGLFFANTPFARATPETRRLAAIDDPQQRARETLAYLKTLPPWPAPLPWQAEAPTEPPADPRIETARSQITFLLQNALLTRITADQFADQIDAALKDVPATDGNQLAPPLQTMAEVARVLRALAQAPGSDDDTLERAALKRQIAHLENKIRRLAQQLADEELAHQATRDLAAKDGFWKSYRTGAGLAAGTATVSLFAVGVPSAAVYFLGADHPAVQAVLTVLGRPPR